MLSRALARSARLAPLSPRLAIATPMAYRIARPTYTIWARGMAKTRRPPKPRSPDPDPSQKPASEPQATPADAGSDQSRAEPSSGPDSPPEQQPTQDTLSQHDTSSLPDLTQGIPSTLKYETSGATNRSALATLEQETPETEAGAGGRARGELPASAYISSTEKRRAKVANRLYLLSLLFGVAGLGYLGRDWDEEEARAHSDIPNGWAIGLWWKRMMARFGDVRNYYSEPAFTKLLPDPDPMFERPYTLCISLEDMLVHSEWSRDHGWRVAKRPGVDYFLHYLSQYYELVLFTSVPFVIADPIVRKLDPFRFIIWPLFREATKYKDGETVKDLSYLNRDLSKVIIIDTKASHVRDQPDNAIVLPPWTGDPKDKGLVALVPFLEYIHTMQYKDVREVLRSFKGYDIPEEFARREAIARADFQRQFESRRPPRKSGIGALGNLLGLKPGSMSMVVPAEGEQSASEAFAQGKMLQDIARDRGRRNYEMMEREIRENGERWLKEEQQANEKAQAEALSSIKTSFTGWFVPTSAAAPGAAAATAEQSAAAGTGPASAAKN
ncbi:NIF-domain-containing protein [Durotheca rogersii]|uniref:NIF-domain-containing protein n=1 Tax=Durotheca rogersii TaxID=419775 RepID=UPI00221FD40D|nr:NIF-domain-containing protein [Durotheca rogersii]KAI5865772.1 NIF-domain-containing protein [Durotheca rogersii]